MGHAMLQKLTHRMNWIVWIAVLFPALLSAQTATVEEPAHPVNWVTLEEAIERCKTEPRKIMVDVYTTWCGPCKMLSKNTFGNPVVAEYLNTHYYCVKFNAESSDTVHYEGQEFTNPEYNPQATGRNSVHQFTRYAGVNAYPTILFMDEAGKFLLPVPGYLTPPQIELYLKLVAEEHYKTITTTEQWQAWQQAFQATWK